MSFSKAGRGPFGREVKKDQDLLGRRAEEKMWTVNDGFTYQKGSSYGRKPEMPALGSRQCRKWAREEEPGPWRALHIRLVEV